MLLPDLSFGTSSIDSSGQLVTGITNCITSGEYELLLTSGGAFDALNMLGCLNTPGTVNDLEVLRALICDNPNILSSSVPYNGTNLPCAVYSQYSSAGTGLYTGSTMILISDESQMVLELEGFDTWYANYFNPEWVPYEFGYSFRMAVPHIVLYSGHTDSYSAVTSIRSRRYYWHQGKPPYYSPQLQAGSRRNVLYADRTGISELRLPAGLTALTHVEIVNEKLSQTSVDSILISLDVYGGCDGYCDLSSQVVQGAHIGRLGTCCPPLQNAAPGYNGLVAKQRLIAKNWIVKTN